VNKPDLSGRLARWVLLLQEFDYEVQGRSGKHHENVVFLSRLPRKENSSNLQNDFPDEHIWYQESEDSIYRNII
jgi:hypothetical protein